MTGLHFTPSLRHGFTLLEMSIVIVIIGIIVGGVVLGAELIRTSEANTIIAEQKAFQTAVTNFEDRYRALPGDMSNASDYWAGESNGDNSGKISANESEFAWRHLAKSGLISGNFNGTGDGTTTLTDSPVSKAAANAVWSFYEIYHQIWATSWFDNIDYHQKTLMNISVVGTRGPFMRPVEAYNVDMKIDDGRPYTGNVIGPSVSSSCNTGTTGNYSYQLNNTTETCSLYFVLLQQ